MQMQFSFDDAPSTYDSTEAWAWCSGAEHGARTAIKAMVDHFTAQGKHAEAAAVAAFMPE